MNALTKASMATIAFVIVVAGLTFIAVSYPLPFAIGVVCLALTFIVTVVFAAAYSAFK